MSVSATIVGKLFLALFFEIFYAPIWWYTHGLVWFVRCAGRSVRETARSLALELWVKNIFVPMYGQYDFWGRVVSFIVRLANIFRRGLWVALWALMCLCVILLWILTPISLLYLFLSGITHLLYV